jgi:hypothetical protein
MRYQRGITLLYMLAAAIWVTWGLYRPVARHRQAVVRELRAASARMDDCMRSKEDEGDESEAAALCSAQYREETGGWFRSLNQGPLEIYRADIVPVAASCLLPPAGGGILLASLFWAARAIRSKPSQ